MIQKAKHHIRNKHQGKYDFQRLSTLCQELKPFVRDNGHGVESIDFSLPAAVKALNKALLREYYELEYWDIPPQSLVPPIPGRADYIHSVADLIGWRSKELVRCLDIGVGANCIYPIVGRGEYGWDFVGSDINLASIANAQQIVERNKLLNGGVELRVQSNKNAIFDGVIQSGEYFDITICNPPFYDSPHSAKKASLRKARGLSKGQATKVNLNFSGSSNELWCDGGEMQFIRSMITQSVQYSSNCGWFTTLVSRSENLPSLKAHLYNARAKRVRVIEMSQGNKVSRILAWQF